MASAGLRAELECSVCLSVYTDPVMLSCGHNFCRLCMDGVLDSQEGSEGYFCPECREEFQQRPTLQRNLTLRNIVENFLTVQADTKQSKIFCTYCIHSPVPAVKSCLLCEASLCEDHLRVHSKSPEHVLCAPTTSLKSRKCSVHKKMLEYYCTEDSACICASCYSARDHRGHQVETLNQAFGKKKKRLNDVLQKVIKSRAETDKRVQSLQERRRKAQEKAASVSERVTALFRDLRAQLEGLEKRVLREIAKQEDHISENIRQLEIKKEELSRKIRHIEELCKMTDPLTVLQESDTGDFQIRETPTKQQNDGGDLEVAVISQILRTGLSDIITRLKREVSVPEPADIVLDENTAYIALRIIDFGKTASRTSYQNYSDRPERFLISQVISRQIFSSGRHYWEVDVGGSNNWIVGVCYPSIEREGDDAIIGYNEKSWGLDRRGGNYHARHNREEIQLHDRISSDRIRVYLDYEAGRISFYEHDIRIRHLHTFTATFTEPLHVALFLRHSSLRICERQPEIRTISLVTGQTDWWNI